MKRAYHLLFLLLAHLTLAASAEGQERPRSNPGEDHCPSPGRITQFMPSDADADFARLAQLTGAAPPSSMFLRRGADTRTAVLCRGDEVARPWSNPRPGLGLPGRLRVEVIPLRSSTHYNSAYPRDRNNGALWAGRGLAMGVSGGIAFRWGPLSGAFAPTIAYQQNRGFDLVATPPREGLSPFVYRGRTGVIDWPRRPGDQSVRIVDPGQSHLRLDIFPIAIGLSTENLWWGPGRRNALIMSTTAPGVPHLFLGSSRPVNIWIGKLEGEMIWGRLDESDFFDDDPTNDRRLLASLAFSFEPRWFPGLYLGASRSYLRHLPPTGMPETRVWLLSPYKDIRDNPGKGEDVDNQLFSVFVRWAPPNSEFEAYFEFGRDDHWYDLKDLAAEPEASAAYTIGFQKVLPSAERWWRVAGEITQMSDPLPAISRGLFTFYVHGQLRQGYTHRGRILGAAIGPNGNSQYLGVDLFTPTGVRGVFIERVRANVDAESQRWTREYGADGADVEWSIGLHQRLFRRHFDLGWSLTRSWRRNRDQIGLYADEPYFTSETNWGLTLDLAWRPGRR